MPWTKDNNNEFLRLLKELNHSVKSRQGVGGGEIPKESEQEGDGNGLVDQARDENDAVKFYSELFSSI